MPAEPLILDADDLRNLRDPDYAEPRALRTRVVENIELHWARALKSKRELSDELLLNLLATALDYKEELGREASALLIRAGTSLLPIDTGFPETHLRIVSSLTETLLGTKINEVYWEAYSFFNRGDSAAAVDYCRAAFGVLATSWEPAQELLDRFCMGMGKKIIRDWNTVSALLDFAAAFPQKSDPLLHGVFLNLLMLKRSLNPRLANDKSDLEHTSFNLHRSLVRLLDVRVPDESIYLLLVTIVRLLPQINNEDRIGNIRALSERFDEDRSSPTDPWRNRANSMRKEIHQKPSEHNIDLVEVYLAEQEAIAAGAKTGPGDDPDMVETARELLHELRLFWKIVSDTDQIHEQFVLLASRYTELFDETMRRDFSAFVEHIRSGSALKANEHLTRFRKALRVLVSGMHSGAFRFEALSLEVSAERSSFACQSTLCDAQYHSWSMETLPTHIEVLCQIVRSVRAFGGGSKELGRTGILLEQEMKDVTSGVDSLRKLIKDVLNLTKQQTDLMKNRYTHTIAAMLRDWKPDLSPLENDRYQIGLYNYFFRSTSFLHLGEFAAFLSAQLLPFGDTPPLGALSPGAEAIFWRFHGALANPLPQPGSLRYVVGGKAAGLLQMYALRLPVPDGFAIATHARVVSPTQGRLHEDFRRPFLQELQALETSTGRALGSLENPLLVSVRSGAPVSMPGMMDTILNIGLNDRIVAAQVERDGNYSFWYDCYIHLMYLHAKSTNPGVSSRGFDQFMRAWYQHKADATSLPHHRSVLAYLKRLYRSLCGLDFPQDVHEQLESAVVAVFESWDSDRARNYRTIHHIPSHLGTGVTIQRMVFGNRDSNSCSGVYFTRDPESGERSYGELVRRGQGEAIVSGQTSSQSVQEMKQFAPAAWEQLVHWGSFLETRSGQAQDMEFVVEQGTLYLLQTRKARLTTRGLLFSLLDMEKAGTITRQAALRELNTEALEDLDVLSFSRKHIEAAEEQGRVLCHGLGVFHGVARGRAAFSLAGIDRLQASFPGESSILIKEDTKPEDIEAMFRSTGCATRVGGPTSHAAINARVIGRPCVVNCTTMTIIKDEFDSILEIRVADKVIHEGDIVSLDGSRALLILGELPVQERSLDEETRQARDTFLSWAEDVRRVSSEDS